MSENVITIPIELKIKLPSNAPTPPVSKNALETWEEIRWAAWENKLKSLEQSTAAPLLKGSDPKAYYKEFGTLKLNFGRMTGNTWFGNKLFGKLPFGQALFVFRNQRMLSNYKWSFLEHVTTFGSLKNLKSIWAYDYVIVDCTDTYSDKDFDFLYDSIGSFCDPKLFVML